MAASDRLPHHQVTLDHPIQSILPGTEGLLLIKTVDPKSKDQTFLLLSLAELEIQQAISFDQNYAGMVVRSFDKHKLLMVQYGNQNNPDQTHVFVFRWSGGDPIFSLTNTRIIQSGLEWIRVPHPNFANKTVNVDLNTGGHTEHIDDYDLSFNIDIDYAMAYPDSSEYFRWFEKYFERHRIKPCRQIEYLKKNESIIISYYEQKDDYLTNTLVFLNDEGDIMDSFLLDQELKGIGKDTFFVFENKVIFVTHKNTLNIYEL